MPEIFSHEHTVSRGAMYNSLIHFHTVEVCIRRKSIIKPSSSHFCRNKCISDHRCILIYKYSADLQLFLTFIYVGDREVALQCCILSQGGMKSFFTSSYLKISFEIDWLWTSCKRDNQLVYRNLKRPTNAFLSLSVCSAIQTYHSLQRTYSCSCFAKMFKKRNPQ